MQPLIAFILGLAVAGVLAWLIFWQRERDSKGTNDAYSRLLDKRDDEYTTLLDRAFVLRNLPPAKVDANKEYEERAQKEREAAAARAKNPMPSRIGPVDSAVLEATMKARQKASGESVN
jgi:hypothetical protein